LHNDEVAANQFRLRYCFLLRVQVN
jgi:hypothetical protein